MVGACTDVGVNQVVVAGPPTVGYKLRKFVRRNKGSVLATSLVLLALLSGIIGTTWGLIRADRHRLIAEAAKEKAEQAEAEKAARTVPAAMTAGRVANRSTIVIARPRVLPSASPRTGSGGRSSLM